MSDNSSFPLFVSSTKKYLIGESELNDWTKIVLWKAITIFIMTKITQNRQDTKLWNTQKKDKKVKMFFFSTLYHQQQHQVQTGTFCNR